MAVGTPDLDVGEGAAPDDPGRAAPPAPLAARRVAPAAFAAAALLWVVVRPDDPTGAAAVVDLLVLPALLAAEVRLLVGRPEAPASVLAAFFGLGAVGATLAALVVERLLWEAGTGALDAAPLVEVAAVCAPPVVFALRSAGGRTSGRRVGPADAALAGLATGLGFLVVAASLAAAAAHVAPDYVSPLVAGLSRIPGAGGDPAVFFAGLPLAAALAGLAAAVAVRLGRVAALALPVLAVALVSFDHAVFQWRLRHLVAGEPAVLGGPAEAVRAATLQGRLAPVLLLAGLGAVRAAARRRPPSGAEPPDGDAPDGAAGAAPRGSGAAAAAAADAAADGGGADAGITAHGEAGAAGAAGADGGSLPHDGGAADGGGAGADAGITAHGEAGSGVGTAGRVPDAVAAGGGPAAEVVVDLRDAPGAPFVGGGAAAADVAEGGAAPSDDDGGRADEAAGAVRRAVLVVAVSAPVAVALVVLAREDGLGFLERRAVAVALALAGFVYAAAALAALPGPRPEPGESRALAVAATACAAAGVVWSLVPGVAAPRPVHGGLLVHAALGWGAHVGNLGAVLGLGGFAAPPARLGRLPRHGAWGLLVGRGGGRFGFGSGHGRLGPLGRGGGRGRRGWSGEAAAAPRIPWWRALRRRRERLRLAMEAEAELVRSRAANPVRPVVVTVEPARARPLSQAEFTGATVREAMIAAFGHLGGLTNASLQLVDEGAPAGKGTAARPARVRVLEPADDEPPLRPPGRDAVIADDPFVVVVDLARDDREELPDAVDVVLRAPAQEVATTIGCIREESSRAGARYRSSPYTVAAGEEREPDDGRTTEPASPLPVADGGTIEAEHDDERATITVYDTWASLVVGVNRTLLDLAAANHASVLAELEDLVRLEAPGHDDARLQHRIGQLRNRLTYVAQARRLLDGGDDLDARAFHGTAVVSMAMSLDRRYDDPATPPALLRAATEALEEHRRAVRADPSADDASGAYRRFLATTALGPLWSEGVSSRADLSRLLGWYRLSDLADDLAAPAGGAGGG